MAGMDNGFLEQYYEKAILPLYEDASISVMKWVDHGQVGPDNYAHHFENAQGVEFILLNEDFPDGSYLSDNLTHQFVPAPNYEDGIVAVSIGRKWVPNISGYFTLYKEERR